jgi:hypothetical protein
MANGDVLALTAQTDVAAAFARAARRAVVDRRARPVEADAARAATRSVRLIGVAAAGRPGGGRRRPPLPGRQRHASRHGAQRLSPRGGAADLARQAIEARFVHGIPPKALRARVDRLIVGDATALAYRVNA